MAQQPGMAGSPPNMQLAAHAAAMWRGRVAQHGSFDAGSHVSSNTAGGSLAQNSFGSGHSAPYAAMPQASAFAGPGSYLGPDQQQPALPPAKGRDDVLTRQLNKMSLGAAGSQKGSDESENDFMQRYASRWTGSFRCSLASLQVTWVALNEATIVLLQSSAVAIAMYFKRDAYHVCV